MPMPPFTGERCGTTLHPRRPWGTRIAFRAFLQHTVEAFAS